MTAITRFSQLANRSFVLFALLLATSTLIFGQEASSRTDQPLLKPTVLARPSSSTTAEIAFPRTTGATHGILIESLGGRRIIDQSSTQLFNPASGVKLATALAALKTFGPDHRFTTGVWITGLLDQERGTLDGDLIISGRDPSFHYEHAVLIARELNRLGLRTVTGDLIVAPRFTMNFDPSSQRSGETLYDTLDVQLRSGKASKAWRENRMKAGDATGSNQQPSVAVMRAAYVGSVPKGARLLITHRSSKLIDVLKVLLCYSNNFMAERLGDSLGGPESVQRLLNNHLGLRPGDISLATASGLGVNRMTAQAMMKILRALIEELESKELSLSDILPVAGIDPGTLEKRYTVVPSRGSVIAKTGTLIRTDGGVSSLVGQMNTASGEFLLFVIFNQAWQRTELQKQSGRPDH